MPSLDLILSAVLYGVVLPAVVTGVGLLLALCFGRGASAAVAVGIAAGLVALAATHQIDWGFAKSESGWGWPERSWDWLPGLALLALGVGLLDQTFSPPVVLRWFLRLIVAGLTGWLLVQAEIAIQASAIQPFALWWSAALVLSVLALWGVLDQSAWAHPGPLQPGLLMVLLFALAGVMEMAGNLSFAQTVGVFGATLLATSVAALVRSPVDLVRAPIPAVAIVLPGFLFANRFNTFASVPSISYLLLLLAPLPLGVMGLTRTRSRAIMLGSGAITLVLIGIAFGLAARASPSE